MTNFAHFEAAEVFDMAIQTEINGKAFYLAAAAAAQDQEIQKIMEFLADAEAHHEVVFRKMKTESSFDAPGETYDGERDEYIDVLLHSRILRDEAAGLQAVQAMKQDQEALDFALAFEKDTILFMFEMREVLPASEREKMNVLIEQERGHVRLLQQMKAQRAQQA
ncbi:MAG: ferritin family protein [Armatimonadota bacterium]